MSDDSEEDYVEFGTALEPLDEEDCPRKKPFTIEEQFARDKQGRRRFHGAFTGGFSAGFLNTVGSLEGWRPSSFKSSKSEKGTAIQQRPEQFMDEEDMGEFGIAPFVLHAKEEFSNTNNNKRKYQDHVSGYVLGPSVLKSLLQPVRETIGIKLLKKMGWKPGQGTGPRVSKNEKKRLSKLRKKVYGCSLPDEKSDIEEEEDDDDVDLENITFAPEDFPFQLVESKENVFGIGYKGLDKRSILTAPQSKTEIRSRKTISGQAFGVGAFEEEDEDIYSREDMSQYDFSLENPTQDGESTSGGIGSEDLYDAFTLALKKVIKKSFPPPTLPKDFKPIHKNKKSRFDQPPPAVEKARKLVDSPERKTADDNAEEILKEAKKITNSASGSKQTSFRPFIADADKQNRYEKYLKLVMAGKKDCLGSLQPLTMTNWERERERIEFEQAAKLFKPLSGVMEDRFTVATQPDDINDPLAQVEKTKSGEDDEIKAAKMNMYGRLTRTIEDWKPCSMLCKRFNIPELNKNEIPIVKNKPKYSIFDEVSTITAMDSQKEEQETEMQEKKTEPVKAVNEEVFNIPDTGNKIDLFAAIFLDSDSDDEQGKETKKEEFKKSSGDLETPYEDTIKNVERNTSPARGIFENLDYCFLIPKKVEDDSKPVEEKRTDEEKKDTDVDLAYGPKLPSTFPVRKINSVVQPVVNDGCWVEKTERMKHKKKEKKEKRKSKKSKHKSKHKHKKSKR